MSTFFKTVHLLPKDLMFEHASAKLVSCPGQETLKHKMTIPKIAS